MCGFAGFIGKSFNPKEILIKMGDALFHRGPDDFGCWFDRDSNVGLSHRRLSIIDLSYSGHQPMESSSGRYKIVYNGEIYNHLKIRNDLKRNGHIIDWKGDSDTETLLEAIDVWGLKKTLQEIIGMFGFALWDRKEKDLYLVCDRMGEKPIYYGWQSDVFFLVQSLRQ